MILEPFPYHRHAPNGLDNLPYTKMGVRGLPEETFISRNESMHKHLLIRRHADGTLCRGICGLLPAAAFLDGRVKHHEQTLRARLARQRERIITDGGALAKPILLIVPSMKSWWDNQPGVQGSPVSFKGVDNDYELRDFYPHKPVNISEMGTLCIADGHHRAESHARLALTSGEDSPFHWVPVVVAGADEVGIDSYARLINPQGLTTTKLLAQLEPYFDIQPIHEARRPETVGQWLLLFKKQYYMLSRREETALTDAGWLNTRVLPAVFGITDTTSDERIVSKYSSEDADGLIHVPKGVKNHIVFRGYPIPRQQFFDEVSHGRRLPPKSTRFEPRVPSGLLVWVP